MKVAFTHAIKFVADMDKAVAFHRDVLGLALRFASPGWSEFDTGAVTLALHPASDRHPAGSVQLGYATPQIEAVYADREAAWADLHRTAQGRPRPSARAHARRRGRRGLADRHP